MGVGLGMIIKLALGQILPLLVCTRPPSYLAMKLEQSYSSPGRSSAWIGERDEADEESLFQG